MERWNKTERRLHTKSHFGDDNLYIQGVILNPVHIINFDEWGNNQEIDFYMDTGSDIYFLRLINNEKNKISFYDSGKILYIIVEKQMITSCINELNDILLRLKEVNSTFNFDHNYKDLHF